MQQSVSSSPWDVSYAIFVESSAASGSSSRTRANSDYSVLFVPAQETLSDKEKSFLEDVAERDPLAEISEQEKASNFY